MSVHKKVSICLAIITTYCLLPIFVAAQSHRIDSLKTAIKIAATPFAKLNSTLLLCREKNSLRGDTLLLYATKAKQLAVQLKDEKSVAWANYYLTTQMLLKGKTDSVLSALDKNSKAIANLNDRQLYYKTQLLKANALIRNNRFNESIKLQLQLLNEAEKDNNVDAQLFIHNYLGAAYTDIGKLDEGRAWLLKGLNIATKAGIDNNKEIQAYLFSNLGLLYFTKYDNPLLKTLADTSLDYLNKSIAICKAYEYPSVLATNFSVKGNLFARLQNYAVAESSLKEGIAIRNIIDDPFYKMNDLINLAAFYYAAKQYPKSISIVDSCFSIANAHNIRANHINLLQVKAGAYKAIHNYEQYSNTLEQYIAVTDSNSKINAARQLAEIQTRYEVQKKETEIAEQKLSLLQRKYLLYGSLIIFVISLLAGYISFKNYRGKQKLKLALILQEEQKQKELAVRNAEEKERTRIAADLHDNIGVQASAILYGTELLKQEATVENNVVDNLYDTAKEMLVNLRETLWAMKHTDITAADLWLRVINFCKQMSRHYMHIKINAGGSLPAEYILTSAKALNLLMIIQEAVNNAAKHAGAKAVTVTSSTINSKWQIKIEDDGNGFDIETARQQNDSNGLGNMQERANAAGVDISFESYGNKGTAVSLSITTT